MTCRLPKQKNKIANICTHFLHIFTLTTSHLNGASLLIDGKEEQVHAALSRHGDLRRVDDIPDCLNAEARRVLTGDRLVNGHRLGIFKVRIRKPDLLREAAFYVNIRDVIVHLKLQSVVSPALTHVKVHRELLK